MNLKAMKKEILRILKVHSNDMDTYHIDDGGDTGCVVQSIFIGTFMYLDPCGKFHHILSPNGITKKCDAYWNRLNKVAEQCDCWISDSPGDGCDVMLNRYAEEWYTRGHDDKITIHKRLPIEKLEAEAEGLFITLEEIVMQFRDLIIASGSIANVVDQRICESAENFIKAIKEDSE